jgi:hypothetical protein
VPSGGGDRRPRELVKEACDSKNRLGTPCHDDRLEYIGQNDRDQAASPQCRKDAHTSLVTPELPRCIRRAASRSWLLQPRLKQQYLEASRQRLIAKIERERKSRVILLVHRQETMSILGFPVFRYIDVNDSKEILRAIHLTDPTVPPDIVLHTPGGLVLAASADCPCHSQAPGQGDGVHPALRNVRRHADRSCSDRDRHERVCGDRSRRSTARSISKCIDSQSGGEKTCGESQRQNAILADQAEKAIATCAPPAGS